ncbi:MAG TPA: MBL fold metallo-hydrolase [Steroidobacteraceae bacterium]|nr:MBL fold metallo-hydrolase [Steroidobacteraceae bacterium]
MSKVEVKTAPIAAHLYVLQGAGGNITAAVGPEGVLLVDDEYAALADRIRAALASIGAKEQPVRFVIDTHYHFDHTAGNLPFAQAGATIIAADELRARLLTGGTIGNGATISREMKAVEPAALPVLTFDHQLTVHLNGEEIRAVHYPHAHTAGDTIVYFPGAHAVAMGDIFVRYGFPFIDLNGGGGVQGMIDACEAVLQQVPADAHIIPGHGDPAGVADLRTYLQMLKDTSAAVAQALKAGKTLAQMKQQHVLAAWSAQYSPPQAFVDTDAFIDTLYNSLSAHAARHGRPRR